MEKIKLVIWDLDETFWKGTLSEEGVVPINANIELVKILSERGIINSIVSKNNFADAEEKLKELGVWQYFVFPIIDWIPKGRAIRSIIESSQLRDVNVLFLDDNHLNLKEAQFYNSNLNVHMPDFISEILEHNSFKGKDDSELSRLKQYKILEKKYEASLKFDNNLSFLRESQIKVNLISDNLNKYLNRILEILERTNQLNYTKVRSNKEEVIQLLNNQNYISGIVRVSDKFGDYGIVGFFSYDIGKNLFLHFSFSCRIINLAVPQYIYSKYNFPTINIIPNVSEVLNQSTPDWITEDSNMILEDVVSDDSGEKKIFFKGGCDLSQMLYYLNGRGFKIIEETNYNAKNNFPIHKEHSNVILDSLNLNIEQKERLSNKSYIPFVDKDFYKTNFFNEGYSCIVYSVLMDYTNEIYYNKEEGISIPMGGYYSIWTESENEEEILYKLKTKNILFNNELLKEFRLNFKHKNQISSKKFIENLKEIRRQVNANTPIVFINGAEVESNNLKEWQSLKRHKLMNKALDEFIKDSKNTYLLDVRNIVKDTNQLTDNIRHYNREVYKEISKELLILLKSNFDSNINTKLNFVSLLKEKLASNKKLYSIYLKAKKIFKKYLFYGNS